ncbi:MAG: hypothetical protein LC135_01740 [Phycisphaerae bacterium]|jgi:hypothetical protein|nr:hypothetical protein [Phycisphaerae bacterium]MCZ2398575.1 hypothetical protein [Phycisphaerae bacterium]NUQ49732.1 hypothetical protein [Phycisphaerae bacterium]
MTAPLALAGCISFGPGTRAHPEDVPGLAGVASLAIDTESVTVGRGRWGRIRSADGAEHDDLVVRPGERFRTRDFNSAQAYRLLAVAGDHAVFDVRNTGSACIQVIPCVFPPPVTIINTVRVQAYGHGDDSPEDETSEPR